MTVRPRDALIKMEDVFTSRLQLIIEAASLPIYWQYVGLGGRNYGILERLDNLPGRLVDNCGFFALDDLHDITEEALYDKLMLEFPTWLKDAKAKGIID